MGIIGDAGVVFGTRVIGVCCDVGIRLSNIED